ncbi:FAD:protein FMN transferase [Celeribacter sp.]|uniref:FAD:protein FMN transferase n=1 Tax=Celeribacter sp. TaxID=1890673 RepID=UPI003A8FC340
MTLSRRRFLTIASAACLTSAAFGACASTYRWQGIALGAKAQIILDHPDAAHISARAQAEISRLEGVFSLYRADSDLMRLNAAGRLDAPSFEMLDCLAVARRVHDITEGRFDPTVQPLWQVVAQAAAQGQAPAAADVAAAADLVGFGRVRFDSEAVQLDAGQALTLNGIAQGYIADRVAQLLRSEGITDVLIDTGEIAALGVAPDGSANGAGWPVTIAGESAAHVLRDRAIATSALMGTVLDGAGTQGHILDPRTATLRPRGAKQLSVSSRSAALADGLSTGLSMVDTAQEARDLLSIVKDARLESFIT